MALPQVSMREMIEAGVHFGHKTKRWNPKMAPFLYGVRNDVHIIDLQQTAPMLHAALQTVRDAAAKNGRILFVGTKRQAADPVAEAATRCGQYYVNHRWLGGMLTNWNTIQGSIRHLRKLDEQLGNPAAGYTKKELLALEKEREKFEKSLGGIKEMGGLPDVIVIIDTIKEELAIKEASRLNIPVVAIVDSNAPLDGVTHVIPGNDDATRAIKLYCRLFSDAALDGLQESMASSGVDMGAAETLALAGEIGEDAPAEETRGKKGAAKKAAPVVVKKPSRGAKAETQEENADAIPAEEDSDASEKPAAKKSSGKKKSA